MTCRKTIAMPISSFLPNLGGMEIGLHNIATRVQARGWEPVVIAPYPHVHALRKAGWTLPYKVEAFPPKIWSILQRWPRLGFQITDLYLAHLNRKYNFDFWHVTMGYPTGCVMVNFAETMLRKNIDIPYLIRCAGEDIQKKPDIGYGMRLDPRMDRIISSYLSRAKCLVAITESVCVDYRGIGAFERVIKRIPNGVPMNRFAPAVNRSQVRHLYGVQDYERLILCVGRNHPKKNYAGLIEAGKLLRDNGVQDFKIMCVGRGCQNLSDLVEQHHLSEHVILREEIGDAEAVDSVDLPAQDLIDLYKSADIFAFPSFTETFGIAIVEAMAAGLPVVVGDSEGCRDVVDKGRWGLLCDPHDPQDLANQLVRLLNDDRLMQAYKALSLKRCKDFDWDVIAGQYIDLYETIV